MPRVRLTQHSVYFRRADFRLIVFDDGTGIKKVNCHLEAVAFRNDSFGKRVRNFGENAAHLL